MQKITQPAHDHTEFDALCAHVDDFEPLPEATALPSWVEPDRDGDEETSLDGQILAGLVSPY